MRTDRASARFGGAQRGTNLTDTTRELNPHTSRLYTYNVIASNTVDCYLPDPTSWWLRLGESVLIVNRGIGGTGVLRLWQHGAEADTVRDFVGGTWETSAGGADYEIGPGYYAEAILCVDPFGTPEWHAIRATATARAVL